MFGHLITMNFNKKGNRHKTSIGAVFSILIKLFIYLYIGLTFKSLLFLDANTNSTIRSIESIESLGTVNYKDAGHIVFYTLRKQIGGGIPIKLDNDLLSYVDLYFIQQENNWKIVEGKNTPKTKRYPVRLCTVDDFKFDRKAKH